MARAPHRVRRLDTITELLGQVHRRLNDLACELGEMDKRQHDMRQEIRGIQPVHVDLDEELGRAIIKKLADPLTVPAAIAAIWAEQAKHGQIMYITHIGYDSGPCAEFIIRPDGTMAVKLLDPMRMPVWSGVFHGPEAER
ncbi:MAG TPA: hypothetical protein VNV62_18595 [Trebonia sp.]|jgi:hypothetical protein|nr:hypothetical protein [Trebonia sp.]